MRGSPARCRLCCRPPFSRLLPASIGFRRVQVIFASDADKGEQCIASGVSQPPIRALGPNANPPASNPSVPPWPDARGGPNGSEKIAANSAQALEARMSTMRMARKRRRPRRPVAKAAAEIRFRAPLATRSVLLPVRPVQAILLASYFTMRAQDYGVFRKTDDNAFDQRTGDFAKVDPAAAALGRRKASC